MTTKIGANAGLVWRALAEGALESKALKKATKLNDKDLFAAIGWLAREGKVTLTDTEKDVLVSLQ